MEPKNEKEPDMVSMFGDWIKSAMKFWEEMPRFDFTQGKMPDFFGKGQKGPAFQTQKSMETGTKIAQALAAIFSEPENLEALFKSTDTVPEFIANLTQQVWEGFFEAQKTWTDKALRIGKHEKAYSFEDLDHETFKSFREIYEKEFQRFFYIPQIGLTRFYQERFNKAIDKHNIFQAALSEFVYMFYVPLEKSVAVMQEKIEEMVDKGELSDNYKDYYALWIKILEGHYMKLLQSPEYTQVMDHTIRSLVQYRQAKDEVLSDFLQNLPIPTNRDMDELYKEFYTMKKQIRKLSKQLKERTASE